MIWSSFLVLLVVHVTGGRLSSVVRLTQSCVAGKRVVHMKKFPLDGDNEGKEASLFVVPVSVKGEQENILY